MSLAKLEKQIWMETREVFNNPKLRLKDLLEWSNREAAIKVNLEDTEVMAALPRLGVWVAVPRSCDKRSER